MTKQKKKLTRLLSIDGGGIRGILPAQIIVALEKKIQQKTNNPKAKIGEYFDFIAGTSTGGILTCIYLAPDLNNPLKARFTAQEASDLYMKNGDKIFSTSFYKRIRSASGILDEKYDATNLELVLHDYLGDLELKDLIKPCLISAYDVYDSKAFFFKQHSAAKSDSRNFLVKQVARATSAAPTYFEATQVTSKSGINYPLIDGGVFANNPAMCAYAEIRQMSFGEGKETPMPKDMLVLSIGTGSIKKQIKYEKVKNWGIAEWIKPLIDIMMSGVEQTIHHQLQQIFEATGQADNYTRIDPILNRAKPDMDCATKENLLALKEAGTKTAEDEKINKKLDMIADLLIENE